MSDQQTRPARTIPPPVLNKLATQAARLGLSVRSMDEGARCLIHTDDNPRVGGPWTHGQSAQSFLDGYEIGLTRGRDEGHKKGWDEGHKAGLAEATKGSGKRVIYVLKTGNTFHSFVLVGNKYEPIDSPKSTGFSMGVVIDAAFAALGITEAEIKYEDRTETVGK